MMGNAIYRKPGASPIRIRKICHKDSLSVVCDKSTYWLEKSVNSLYQKWTGYPDSPLTFASGGPYQCIRNDNGGERWLILSQDKLYTAVNGLYYEIRTIPVWSSEIIYRLVTGVWTYIGALTTDNYIGLNELDDIEQCNYDVYADVDMIGITKAKTTTPSQDGGIAEILHRINV